MNPLYCENCQKIFTVRAVGTFDAPCPHCKAPPIFFRVIDARLWRVFVAFARGLAETRPYGVPREALGSDVSVDVIVREAVADAKMEIGSALLEALGVKE